MAVNVRQVEIGPEFAAPPADPVTLLRNWFDQATARGVREPGAIALATVASDGTPSSRMIQLVRITDRGLVFATHSGSRKGQEIDQTRRWSGVAYWRETNQQITFGGDVLLVDGAVADSLWERRSASANAMSAATRQSEPLAGEQELLDRARSLTGATRPSTWVAYELLITEVEFWQSSPDGLYRRLRYDRTGTGWTSVRLQP